MSLSMKSTLKQLRGVTADPALSVIVKTHRTHPENEQDPIALKNGLSEAAERLANEYDKRTSDAILGKVEEALTDYDHNYNLDSLAIFATADEAKVLRLPVDATPRVVVDKKFATRDFVRDLAHSVHYYALVVTRTHARLIEAVNNRVVREFDDTTPEQTDMQNLTFPIDNTSLYTTSGADRSAASNEDNYLKEFLNRVDKSVQELIGKSQDNVSLFVVGDARNISFYKDVCDRPDIIASSADNVTDLEDGSAQHIIDSLNESVESYRASRHESSLGEMEAARGNNLLRTDLQAIYQAAFQGIGERLYVRIGYIQPAVVDEANQSITLSDDAAADGVTDDVVGEIIELVSAHGGEVVFLPKEIIADTDIALVTRY